MRSEYRFRIGDIPVVKTHHEPRPRPAVVVLHGLGASANAQRKELESLADEGFAAVGVDAPHHGVRADGWLERMQRATAREAHALFLEHLVPAIEEIPRVVDHLAREGHGPIGLLGVSMGAYTALGAAAVDARVRATVSLLGSPDWSARSEPGFQHPLMDRAPSRRPDALLRSPVLFVNAALDVNVPARLTRHFVEGVRHPHAAYLEYAHSDHFMRPQDWDDAWSKSVAFLRTHLG